MLSSRPVEIVKLAVIVLALCVGSLSAQNVLLFTIDSCRADHFGCYGYSGNTTPNIDAWSQTGTLFQNSYSTSVWTAPGLLSILTGLDPPTHDVNNRDHMGSPDLLTLIKIFKGGGYQVPNLNFFTFAPYYRNLGLPDIDRDYFTTNPGDELLNWLQQNTGLSESKPMFVWYHTTLLHQPYNPHFRDLPAAKEKLQESPGIRAVMTGAIVPEGSTRFKPEDLPILNALYDAELRRIDCLFGKVLDLLKQKKLLEKTLVILTADHGEELLDHGFVGHASTSLRAKLYEELVRIPLILSWPGKIEADQKVLRRVNQTDLFPTILKLFEIKVPDPVQGQDLFGDSPQRPLFFESVIGGNQTTKEREGIWVRAVLKDSYKYIFRDGSIGELYNLRMDPGETVNLAEAKPQISQRLQAELNHWHQQARALRARIFSAAPEIFTASENVRCPGTFTPGNGKKLEYDIHTGHLLLDWSGDMDTTYVIEYDIGTGNHHVAGAYEVQGNHQLLGPIPRELWEENLKAWNPFKIRVSPKSEEHCWSDWVAFNF